MRTELVALAANTGAPKGKISDTVARQLAVGFEGGSLGYIACDDMINEVRQWTEEDLLGEMVTPPDYLDLFWPVYDAFDAGERFHEGDSREVDPVEKYTRPKISDLVRGLEG